jgi:hypothetical protein
MCHRDTHRDTPFDEVMKDQPAVDLQQPASLVDPPEQNRREAQLFAQDLDLIGRGGVVAGDENGALLFRGMLPRSRRRALTTASPSRK